MDSTSNYASQSEDKIAKTEFWRVFSFWKSLDLSSLQVSRSNFRLRFEFK